MQRVMLKSKIHRATVTDSDLHYVGSITIDPELLRLRHARVRAGARRRRRQRCALRDLHDPRRARLGRDVRKRCRRAIVHRGDTIIVISYGSYDEADLERYVPRVVHVETDTNRIVTIDEQVATLLS